jgi:lysozyme
MNPFIIDISFWQDTADFHQMKANGAKGVILRAGQGVREDIRFQRFRAGAKEAGLPFGNYFYYDNRIAPKRQAEKWASIIGNDEGVLGSWLDLEQEQYTDYKGYKHWWDCVAYFKQIVPNTVLGIYTRASYFNDPVFNIPINHAFRNLPLWVAHYNNNVAKPDLPKGWATWQFWQITDSGNGTAYGVGSKEIDLNYYNGSEQDFTNRYTGEVTFPSQSNFFIKDFQMKYTAVTISNGTRMRADHNTFASVLTSFPANTELEGEEVWDAPADGNEVRKGDKWLFVNKVNGIPLASKGWVAVTHKGQSICFKEVTSIPSVPVFPQKFTLTDDKGTKAEYAFVRVIE